MIDLVLIAIVAVVAWCVSGEGAYSAGTSLIIVIISGLMAMNYFEPLATILENNVSSSWATRWDMIALIGLFAVFVTLFRLASEYFMPTYVQVNPLLHQAASWGCGVLTGYVTMAFLLTAFHTAPLPRDYGGFFYPERERRSGPLSQFGPDYQWLGFTQYVTEKPFGKTIVMRPKNNPDDPVIMTRMFDGRNGWLWNIPARKDSNEPYDVMPSFPIRYAARRELFASGGNSGPAIKIGPVSTKKSRGGRGTRGGGM